MYAVVCSCRALITFNRLALRAKASNRPYICTPGRPKMVSMPCRSRESTMASPPVMRGIEILLSGLAADEVADLDAAVTPFGEDRCEQREDVQLVGPDRQSRIDAR